MSIPEQEVKTDRAVDKNSVKPNGGTQIIGNCVPHEPCIKVDEETGQIIDTLRPFDF